MNTYFSTFIPGLGEVVNDQLAKKLQNFEIYHLFDGLIVYRTSSSTDKIRGLQFLNNSFLLLKKYKELRGEPISAMAKIAINQSLPNIEFSKRTFRIVFSLANKPVSVEKGLLNKLEEKITSRYKLTVDRTVPDMEFWFIYREESYGFFGLRLTKHPDWKTVLDKGQLRPELANLLCLISEPSKNDIVLDPFTGSGAIPKMRRSFPHKEVIAGDIKPKDKSILLLDALSMNQFKAGSIDKIVTDPPWGIELGKDLDLPIFYTRMLREFIRVLSPGGLVVILIGKKELFEKVLGENSQLYMQKRYNILVSGKKTAVYKLLRL